MNEAQQLLIRITGGQLFGKEAVETCKKHTYEEWEAILTEAKQQAVFPMVFSCVKNSLKEQIAAEAFSRYEKLYFSYIAAAIKNDYCHKELHQLLTANDISYVILKGQASAMFYPDAMQRQMGDVDFLVYEKDVAKADEVLRKAGYKKNASTEKHAFHFEYRKNDESAELHWNIPGIPVSEQDLFRKYTDRIIEEGIDADISGKGYNIPSKLHHGMILLLHTISHLTSSGVGLRHLCDWLAFENTLTDEEFMTLFERPLKETGLWKFAQIMTKTGILYFGAEKRSWCNDADQHLCAAFIEDIFAGGNFGEKDSSRKNQTKLIRDNTSRRISNGSVMHNIFANLNFKVRRKYPLIYQYKIFMPVGWLLIIGQYMFRVISGKRESILSKELYSAAMHRQQLYAELNLFEPEENA